MKSVFMVITNSGDGSNAIQWVTDKNVLDKMEELADGGDDSYASGDGLQVTMLKFPDDFNIQSWMELNLLSITTMDGIISNINEYFEINDE